MEEKDSNNKREVCNIYYEDLIAAHVGIFENCKNCLHPVGDDSHRPVPVQAALFTELERSELFFLRLKFHRFLQVMRKANKVISSKNTIAVVPSKI
mmetsp:Transcript_26678/g.38147  ORF Transcript_26678/g.38147 Transcript_26678/m.38147 type:complete len:96 (+) Transcript_26678:174-461(+)